MARRKSSKRKVSDVYETRNNLSDLYDGLIHELSQNESLEFSFDTADAAFTELENILKEKEGTKDVKDDKATAMKSVDAVSAVSVYRQLYKKHDKRKDLREKYNKQPVEIIIRDYHFGDNDAATRTWLRYEIFFRIFFLLPHAVKKQYRIVSHMFNDAIQNLSIEVLKAIEQFDATKGYTFTNYLVGYFRSGIARTFNDSNVVAIQSVRRKMLREQGESHCEPNEITSYTGLEYNENSAFGQEFDFEEYLHNKQLEQWLEEAMSREAEVITEDERRVLVYHYGLFRTPKRPYREIAKMRAAEGRGCAYSRLSQIHSKAIQKLKRFFFDRMIEEY